MTFDLVTAAVAFGSIFVIELPDKTFVATLVMSTRWRPLLVWVGVCLAFLLQTLVAVALGGVLTRLPHKPVEVFAALMFLVGGIILLRGARHAKEEEEEAEEEFGEKTGSRVAKGWHVVAASFGILFLAEWGDLSQILTATLVLRYHEPLSVFVGAFLALAAVSGLAALLGRVLLTRIPIVMIRRIGGCVCLLLALVTALEVAGVI